MANLSLVAPPRRFACLLTGATLAALALAGCRVAAPAVALDETAARQAIESRIADWARWTAAGDIDAVADIFASDVWEADPNRPPVVGRAAIVEHWRRGMARGRWEFEPRVEDVIVRDGMAMERTSYTLRFTAKPGAAGPASIEDKGSWVNVWRLDQDGRWRMLWTIAASALPRDRSD